MKRRLPFHYGWVIVFAGVLTVFACLGLGRFALGMLLPSMGDGLSLSYSQMGFIGTANFGGYLAAVVVAGGLARRYGSRAVIAGGLAVAAVSMALMGQVGGFLSALLLYTVTGVGSGLANVPIMGLVSHWFARRVRGRAAGFMVVGNGLAIVASGFLVPVLNATGAEGWRLSWTVLGGVALAATVLVALVVREDPADMGLDPVGGHETPRSVEEGIPEEAPRQGVLGHLGVIYLLFGATYSIYVTFIVTTLVDERGFSEAAAGGFWAWVGALSLLSGPVFGTLSDKAGRRVGLITVFAFQTGAYLLAAFVLPLPLLYLSIGLFGVVAWSVPTIMAAAVGDYMGPKRAAQAFGTVTVLFGAGQIVGPALAGVVAEGAGGFSATYLMAAAGTLTAIGLTAFLRPARSR